MSAAGVILIALAILIGYEAIKGGSAVSAAGSTVPSVPPDLQSGSGMTTITAPVGGGLGTAQRLESNVRSLAAWARRNNIDPRVALTILAAEGAPAGGGTHVDTNGQVSTGPLQINAVHAPGGQASQAWITSMDNIFNALGVIGGRWIGSLRGLTYSQFMQNPQAHFIAAQGARQPEVGRNFTANGNYQSQVESWCREFGVCQ